MPRSAQLTAVAQDWRRCQIMAKAAAGEPRRSGRRCGRTSLTPPHTQGDVPPRWPRPARRNQASACSAPRASAHARPSSGCRLRVQVALRRRTGRSRRLIVHSPSRIPRRRGLGRRWCCCRRPAAHLLPQQRAALPRWLPLPVRWQPRLPRVRLKGRRSPICGSSI